nr:MAG TPA: SAGA-associated factor 73-FINGER, DEUBIQUITINATION, TRANSCRIPTION FACTOR, SAGA [Caudoviricetes sp.]
MIGDIYLFIKQFLKEQFCIHEYYRESIDIQTWRVCKKCGRVRL